VQILGATAVRHGGQWHHLTAALPRRLLGLLALRHPAGVPVGDVVDALWEEPPRTARSLIHVYVGRLRRMLEPERVRGERSTTLLLQGDGLRLCLPADQLDLAVFDRDCRQAGEVAADDPAAAYALLRQALDGWRTPVVLGGVDPVITAHPTAVGAVGRRLQAVLTAADLALDLDVPQDAVELLRAAAGAEALHEGVHARLISALGVTGEQAQALEVFASFRRRLRDELGIDPGAEVREAYLGVLRQEAPVEPLARQAPVPAQLPAEAAGYAGRRRQLGQLEDMLDNFAARAATGVLAIVGAPGVGKTALAVRWATEVRDRFTDGQLYANLRGNASIPPARPVEVLVLFLRALGVPAERVPAGLDEAAALFRTLVSDRRLLIVLDDAAGVEQVRPLLPGGTGCVVLVTSRNQLSGLVAREGAQRLTLDVLSPDESTGLLVQLLQGADLDPNPGAIAELARICGWLPLAIRIAAANLLTRGDGTVAGYCAELRAGNVLNGLQVDGDDQSAVRAAFDRSFRHQSAASRRLFRLLSLMPGADLPAEAAAALADDSLEQTDRELRHLTGMHLLDRRTGGRYGLHDLLRRYAGELAATECDPVERRSATDRLTAWYADRVDAAAALLYPDRLRVPGNAPGGPRFDGPEAALAWLGAERSNLVEVVTRAAAQGRTTTAWRLADTLHGWFALTMYTVDWQRVAAAGLQAAVADGDPQAQVAALLSAGSCEWVQGHNVAALDAYERAAGIAHACGWTDGEAEALSALGSAHDEAGRPAEATAYLARARALTRRSGRRDREAAIVFRIGLLRWKAGDLARAADRYRQAAALYRGAGSHAAEAISLTNLGMIYRAMGRSRDTVAVVSEALAVHRATGNQVSEAIALCSLAGAECDLGHYRESQELAWASHAAAVGVGHKRLEANASNAIADVLARTGQVAEAIGHYRHAVRLATEAHDRHPEVHALVGLAAAELGIGDLVRAREDASAALETARASQFRVYEGRALSGLAAILLADGDVAGARSAAEAGLAVHERCGHVPGQARTHLLMGRVLSLSGRPAEAFGHLRRARDLFAAMGSPEFADARAGTR
jgi:tetratricopeptide (TPR) repeat protein/DNA-binding SARP family transcriptional activator